MNKKVFNFIRSLIVIFLKVHYLLEQFNVFIIAIIDIASVCIIKLTNRLNIIFSHFQYMKQTCDLNMFVNIILFKTNYYILWFVPQYSPAKDQT